MQNNAIKNLVIVGGGTAGWMAAAAFARMYEGQNPTNGLQITLVESDAIGTVGVGEATIPNITDFNRMLGIDEADFMANTQGTFKLGIEFVNWGRPGDRYIHPFGQHGADMDGIYFHHYWRRMQDLSPPHSIENYSLAAVAARASKFAHPSGDMRSPLSQLGYAYHFDAILYAQYLRKYAESRGVKRVEGRITAVEQDEKNGNVTCLKLENGQSVSGDFFIDCSGFHGLLMNKTLDVGYEDWSHWLPCDSALAVPCEHVESPIPYTRATALTAGWQWRIPTQHRMGNGHVYCSDYISDDEAASQLLAGIDGTPLADPRQIRFQTGHRKSLWEKNVVCLGLASGFLEPLESTSIYLIQAGISRLMALFPGDSIRSTDRDEYNRLMRLEFEQIRDFIILHYHTTERDDTPFWNYCRTMSIPESLQRKIDLFHGTGRFFRYEGDLFSTTSWVAVLLGQNIIPAAFDPIVASMSDKAIIESLGSMQQGLKLAADKMQTHEAFLKSYCPAKSHS